MSKMREKESLECVRLHIWALKTQKLPGPSSGPWTPAADCSLRSPDSALLRRQLSASEAGPPLDQILDPHLSPRDSYITNSINSEFNEQKLLKWLDNQLMKLRLEVNSHCVIKSLLRMITVSEAPRRWLMIENPHFLSVNHSGLFGSCTHFVTFICITFVLDESTTITATI